MKIVHVVRQFYPSVGGVEEFVLGLARRQVRDGNEVTVVTLDRSFATGERFGREERLDGIRIRRIPFAGSPRYPLAPSCVFLIKDGDLVHVHCVDFFVDYLVALKPFHRKPIVLHTHGGFFHTKRQAALKRLYFTTVTRAVLKGCDRVIACSPGDLALFSRIASNVTRIDNGVDVERYTGLVKDLERGMLLSVGRIDSHKRIDRLIRLVARVAGQGVAVRLVVAGADWRNLVPGLKALAQELGVADRVVFTGAVSAGELARLFARAHLFVSASEYEGFGISLVEAMASGTVAVASDIASFRDILKEGGGFLADCADTAAAADTVVRALGMDDGQYRAESETARQASKRYSWDAVAGKVSAVYDGVLGRGRKLKLCLAGSSGGHLLQVYNLKAWWERYDRFWVTFDKDDARSLLKGEKVYHAFHPTNRNLLNLVRNTVLAVRILLRERPDVVFSTGAGVSIPFFYVGKLLGATLIFLEIYDRIDCPTLTGRVVYPLADVFLVQWKEQQRAFPKGRIWGQAI